MTDLAPRAMRSDAERNRARVLAAARDAFADPRVEVSMAEIARRAGVGMATLYRNFPGRRELLEAVHVDQVDAICTAAERSAGATAAERLTGWLRLFAEFLATKDRVAAELLQQGPEEGALLHSSRARVIQVVRPLLEGAQEAGEVRRDLTVEQVLDLVIAVGTVRGEAEHVEPLLRVALDGLRVVEG